MVDIGLQVEGIPPVKQTPADGIERARQAAANEALAEAVRTQLPENRMILRTVDLALSVRYERGRGRSDSANIIGGIADQLQRCNIYWDDAQLRRIEYAEVPSSDGGDRYSVRLTGLSRD